MAASMVVLSRRSIQTGMSQHHQAQAFYLAESGLARAMVALENDLGWPGVTDASIEGIPGTYTVTFGNGKYGSVNNISTDAAKDSYRGDDTIPIDHALLIVQAEVAGQTYVLEALVKGLGSVGFMSDAILSSGRIHAEGDLHIDGIAALDDSSSVDGSIQSNQVGAEEGLISWSGEGNAFVSGTVGTGGSTDGAIAMDGATILGGPELNTTHNIPNYDIAVEVSSHDHHPSPSISDGGTVNGGQHYLLDDDPDDGDPIVINGDLVLEEDAELYIDGDLVINGSIKGSGTIWVNGETTFRGDSEVTTNSEFSISLHSKGSVKLTGFDGTEFMSHMDAETQLLLDVSEYAVTELRKLVNASNSPAEALEKTFGDDEQDYWDLTEGMALHGAGKSLLISGHENGALNGEWQNVMGQLEAKIAVLDHQGETSRFLSNRLEYLKELFSSGGSLPETEFLGWNEILDRFDTTGQTAGFIDAAMGKKSEDHWDAVKNLSNSVNYDKPGAAYFQGAIYTQGFFYADNEINVLGAIIVDGNGGAEQTFTRRVFDPQTMGLVDGEPITLSSGDVYLGNRTRVTYVEEFFNDDPTQNSGPQNLAGVLWMGR